MSTLKRKAAAAAADASKKPKTNGSITAFFGAPKPNPNSPAKTGAAAKFDRDAWIAGLDGEQKELLQLELDTLHESWLPHLKDVLVNPQFLELKRFLKKELSSGKTVFPPMEDVYSWSRHTPLNTVKVVITGQDPYHGPRQAHGLCFSIRPPTPAPPSLQNIYKALKKDYPDYQPPPNKSGLLTPWAERGVLLLNTCLTVRKSEANSHAGKGWELLTQKVIDTVVKVRTNGVVFLAWGTPAQKRTVGIPVDKHLILKSVHPSPLSAARGFFDCHHFTKCNKWLVQRYGKDGGIDWNLNVDGGASANPTAEKKVVNPAPPAAKPQQPISTPKKPIADEEVDPDLELSDVELSDDEGTKENTAPKAVEIQSDEEAVAREIDDEVVAKEIDEEAVAKNEDKAAKAKIDEQADAKDV
ncbi:uracil-DNA glycosylase [Plenodomus tracheiphilus IPT5]|uniref:Uracil-DNA glycosylase n=1 Tax=Plenodomus tracheiphilus IPT5 TaxID=1408161 RepID=A0A6A7B953_9PLEO|nr:uracil-DNA glycosylase [Plenodomus tracheiphilus IPT5]